MQVRCLREGEAIPFSLQNGFENLVLQPEWCWVATREEEVIALLMACNNHGIALLWRFIIKPNAPRSTALLLLRRMLSDCRARGVKGYMAFLDITRPAEHGLAKIAVKAGAKIFPAQGIWVSGTTEVYR